MQQQQAILKAILSAEASRLTLDQLDLAIQRKQLALDKQHSRSLLLEALSHYFSQSQLATLFQINSKQKESTIQQIKTATLCCTILEADNILEPATINHLIQLHQSDSDSFHKLVPLMVIKIENMPLHLDHFPVEEEEKSYPEALLVKVITACQSYRVIRNLDSAFKVRWIERMFQPLQNGLIEMYAGQSRLHRLDMPSWMFDNLYNILELNARSVRKTLGPKHSSSYEQQVKAFLYQAFKPITIKRILLNLSACLQNPLLAIKLITAFGQFEQRCERIIKHSTLMQQCLLEIDPFLECLIEILPRFIQDKLGPPCSFNIDDNSQLLERVKNILFITERNLAHFTSLTDQALKRQLFKPFAMVVRREVENLRNSFNALFKEHSLTFEEVTSLYSCYQQSMSICLQLDNLLSDSQLKDQIDRWSSSAQLLQNKLAANFSSQYVKDFKRAIFRIGSLVFQTIMDKLEFETELEQIRSHHQHRSKLIKNLSVYLIPALRAMLFDLLDRNIEVNLLGMQVLFEQLEQSHKRMCEGRGEIDKLWEVRGWMMKSYNEVKEELQREQSSLTKREGNILLEFKRVQSQ